MSVSHVEGAKDNLPPVKRMKVDCLKKDCEDAKVRTFNVTTLGGEEFEVNISAQGNVGDLETEVAKSRGLGLCFTLIGPNNQQLNDISAPLPDGNEISCHVENPSELCAAARKVLNDALPEGKECPEEREVLRLGRCRKLGESFPGSKWKKGGIDSAISHAEVDSGDETNSEIDMYGDYDVYEFTLIDGDDKCHRLIGIINGGDADANTGMWGSVYLRPGFQEVGKILSTGDCQSRWSSKAGAWYNDPSTPLKQCNVALFGGHHASTPLCNHLAHALESATQSSGTYYEP